MKRHILPGSRETLETLKSVKFDLYVTCRVMKALVRNAEHLIKQCERYGSTSNFARTLDDVSVKLVMAGQDAIKTAGNASQAIHRFNKRAKPRGS